jgi:hypothetical protein
VVELGYLVQLITLSLAKFIVSTCLVGRLPRLMLAHSAFEVAIHILGLLPEVCCFLLAIMEIILINVETFVQDTHRLLPVGVLIITLVGIVLHLDASRGLRLLIIFWYALL